MDKSPSGIPELDRTGLTKFGLVLGSGVALLFGLLLPWLFGRTYPLWPWLLLAVFAVWGQVAPMTLRPVYRGWMRVGLLMSRITTPLILGLVFYFVITPFALILRIFGKDSMKRSFENVETYRVEREAIREDSLEHPY